CRARDCYGAPWASVRVQPWAWNPAGDAAGACNGTGRARARRRGLGMRTAVVLFNLGGPDSLAAVRPFLTNLFDDPAIIRMPRMPRWLLARVIAWRRAPLAREIYRHLGGS